MRTDPDHDECILDKEVKEKGDQAEIIKISDQVQFSNIKLEIIPVPDE